MLTRLEWLLATRIVSRQARLAIVIESPVVLCGLILGTKGMGNGLCSICCINGDLAVVVDASLRDK